MTRHRSASRPSRSAASSSSGRSPTIVIRAGSSPSDSTWAARNGPFRSVRSPRTSSLPVTTIAARGRCGRTTSRGRPGRCPPAVTIRLRGCEPPTRTPRPFNFIFTFSGEPMYTQSPCAALKRCASPGPSVPFQSCRPCSEPARTIRSVLPPLARTSRPPTRFAGACAGGFAVGVCELSPPYRQAAITSAVTTAIPTRANQIMFDSSPRRCFRVRRGGALPRTRRSSSSSPDA